MTMHDANTLAAELLQRLAELEQKVHDHRLEMANEFRRRGKQVLENAPQNVSAEVERTIRESLHNYPAISPALDHANPIHSPRTTTTTTTSPNHEHDRQKRGKSSPPPVLPHTSGVPPDGNRGPHEREREFHGVFTPSYLALLGASGSKESPTRDQTSPPVSPLASLQEKPQIKEPDASPPSPEQSKHLSSPPSLAPGADLRPEPVRRQTGDTVSSNTSDDSGSRTRRSALRRSSSSSTSKTQSPRRVRFEVEGGEVLPTVSPPTSPRIADIHIPSPLGSSASVMDDSPGPTIVEIEESSDASHLNLLGSSPPTPKKITSTDRLKAMARKSREDTSQWKVVGDAQEMEDDEDMLTIKPRSRPAPPTGNETHEPHTPLPADFGESRGKVGAMFDDAVDAEDSGMLETHARSRGRNPAAPYGPISSAPGDKVSSLPANAAAKQQVVGESIATQGHELDEDGMFDYEPDEDADGHVSKTGTAKAPEAPSKYIDEADEDEAEEVDGQPVVPPKSASSALGIYSTLPAVPITKPAPVEPATTPSRFQAVSVGSYKGRPLSITSVNDNSVLRKAAELGDFYSFVGSVDGRSGVDESTSYRPARGQFSGTPKSFSERFIKEEMAEASPDSSETGTQK